MKPEDLINWNQLSKLLCGSKDTIRRNRIPKIHREFIDDLLKAIDEKLKARQS
jgi:hypothetical protein